MQKINLWPFQRKMVDTIIEKSIQKKRVLAKAPTGAGKTIMFCEIIKGLLRDYPKMRICVLAHREILVSQNADKLKKYWPEAEIGIACSSASKDVRVGSSVVIGSIQTMEKRIGEIPPFDLVIIDEAHRLPPATADSQYKRFLDAMEGYNPSMRIFGLTATPFRLNHGPIYGKKHKRQSDDEPCANWFDDLDYELNILDLMGEPLGEAKQDEGNPTAPYLCGLRVFAEDKGIELELEKVKTTGGEYNQKALGDLMRGSLHVSSAVKSYLKHREGRERCVVFGVDIEHAKDLVEAFNKEGVLADCVHSEMKKEDRLKNLAMFEEGALPVIVNVGVLTEGWDCRAVDMGIMARPTLSAALFVQMVGRGLRTFPGKRDFLLLDLAGNFNRHGPPWDVVLPDYSSPGRPKEDKKIPDKKCPVCETENPSGTWTCIECGTPLRVKAREDIKHVSLRELDLVRVVKPVKAEEEITGKVIVLKAYKYTPKNGKEDCLRVDIMLDAGLMFPIHASHFFRFSGPGAFYGRKWWRTIFNSEPPTMPTEAEERIDTSSFQGMALRLAKRENSYWRIKSWE